MKALRWVTMAAHMHRVMSRCQVGHWVRARSDNHRVKTNPLTRMLNRMNVLVMQEKLASLQW
jgi:hypothetical protein